MCHIPLYYPDYCTITFFLRTVLLLRADSAEFLPVGVKGVEAGAGLAVPVAGLLLPTVPPWRRAGTRAPWTERRPTVAREAGVAGGEGEGGDAAGAGEAEGTRRGMQRRLRPPHSQQPPACKIKIVASAALVARSRIIITARCF
jgi:hypothetical protein